VALPSTRTPILALKFVERAAYLARAADKCASTCAGFYPTQSSGGTHGAPVCSSPSWFRLGLRLLWAGAFGVALWLVVTLSVAWLLPSQDSVLKVWWR